MTGATFSGIMFRRTANGERRTANGERRTANGEAAAVSASAWSRRRCCPPSPPERGARGFARVLRRLAQALAGLTRPAFPANGWGQSRPALTPAVAAAGVSGAALRAFAGLARPAFLISGVLISSFLRRQESSRLTCRWSLPSLVAGGGHLIIKSVPSGRCFHWIPACAGMTDWGRNDDSDGWGQGKPALTPAISAVPGAARRLRSLFPALPLAAFSFAAARRALAGLARPAFPANGWGQGRRALTPALRPSPGCRGQSKNFARNFTLAGLARPAFPANGWGQGKPALTPARRSSPGCRGQSKNFVRNFTLTPSIPALRARLLPALLLPALLLATAPASAQTVECTTANADGSYTVPSDWALTPSGLAGGATFRLLFMTNRGTMATSTDIATYNTFAQTSIKGGHSAIRDSCGNRFKVVASTAAVNARQNTDSEATDTDAALYWLGNDAKVADDYADFYDGSWSGGDVGVYPNGSNANSAVHYWTGSNNDGTGTSGRTLGTNSPIIARVQDRLHRFGQSRNTNYLLLAMSPVFAVQAPPGLKLDTDPDMNGDQDSAIALTELGGTAATATYTIALNTDPGSGNTITVTPASGKSAAVTVSPSSALSFTGGSTGTWDDPRTLTVTAVNDGDDIMDESVTVSHALGGATAGTPYDGVTLSEVTVEVTDAGHAVIFSKSALSVEEDEDTDTYTVRLTSDPGAFVTTPGAPKDGFVVIQPGSDNAARATAAPAELTLNQDNWSVPQTVTVTGKEAGSTFIHHRIIRRHAASGYPLDDGITKPRQVAVTVTDVATAIGGPHRAATDWALKPAGLNAGDSFRLLFVTADWRNAESMSIATYNAHVQAQANGGHTDIRAYSDDFRVVGSTATVNAIDNVEAPTATTGIPIYWLDASGAGAKVADDYADFWDDSWDNNASTDRRSQDGLASTGNTPTNWVWTGSTPAGIASAHPLGSANPSRGGFTGSNAGNNPESPLQVMVSDANAGLGVINAFYALSPVFMVTAAPDLTLDTDPDMNGNQDSAIALTELGGAAASATYTIALDTDPGNGNTVTVTPTSGKSAAVTVSPSTALTFTGGGAGTWNNPRTVTVTAVNDGSDVANESVTITHTLGGAAGTPYEGLTLKDVTVTVTDAGHAVIAGTTELSVDEDDDTDTYTLRLASAPGGTVTVTPTSGATGVATVSAAVSFDNSNWRTPKTVTVTGREAGTSAVTHAITTGVSGTYPTSGSGVTLPTVTVTVEDVITAVGGPHKVAADWALKPTGLSVGDSFRLLFVTYDWHHAQSAAISRYNAHVQTRAADADGQDAAHAQIRAYSADFRAVGSTATVAAIDNVAAPTATTGIPIYWLDAAGGGAKVADDYADFWDGSWDNYASADRRDETGAAVSGMTPGDWPWTGTADDGTASAKPLGSTFPSRGRLPPDSPLHNNIAEPANNRHSFYALSPVFTVVSPDLTLDTDPDMAGEQDSAIALTELGGAAASATYTIALNTDPGNGETITVTPTSGKSAAVTVSPSSALSFTGGSTGTWDDPQTVTVTAVNDGSDVANERVTVSHALGGAAGTPYAGVTLKDVTVTVTDAGHAVIAGTTELSVDEGDATETYTLRLASAPGGTVTVTPASGTAGVATVSAAVSFTDSNWQTLKTVTVTGKEAGTSEVTHAITTGVTGTYPAGMTGLPAVAVTVNDVITAIGGPHEVAVNWVLKPTALSGGDSFRLLFITSGGHPATSAAISRYNAHVQWWANHNRAHAQIRAYKDDVRAVGSTATVDAIDNVAAPTSTTGIPIYWLDAAGGGAKVADNYTDFWDGSWDNYAGTDRRDESGAAPAGGVQGDWSWTGTAADGTASSFPLGSARPTRGGLPDNSPLNYVIDEPPGNFHTFYALSPVFTVRTAPDLALDTDPDMGGEQDSAIALTELGGTAATATYTLALDTDPGNGNTITVTPTSGKTAAVTVSPSTALTFTGGGAGTWNNPRTVTVTAVNDGSDVANERVTVSHALGGAAGTPYEGFTLADVTVTVTDAGHAVVAGKTELSVDEDDATDTYTLRLASAPGGPVTVTPTSGTPGAATVSGAVSFNNSNWQSPKTVTVTGKEPGTSAVTHAITTGVSGTYPTGGSGVTLPTVTVTTEDVITAIGGPHEVAANWALKPSALSAGDSFRLLFVTADWHNAESMSIATYNAHVQSQANGGHTDIRAWKDDFRVVGSTATVDAIDNVEAPTATTGIPIYWLDASGGGAKVADDYADFWDDSWDNNASADRRSQDGLASDGNTSTNWTWTGSTPAGIASAHPLGSDKPSRGGFTGSESGHNPGSPLQVVTSDLNAHSHETNALYALSPVFTVSTAPALSTGGFSRDTNTLVRVSLFLANGPGATWYWKRTAPTPAGSCTASNSNLHAVLDGLTPGTAYTFTAYSDSACSASNELADLTFTAPTVIAFTQSSYSIGEGEGSATITVRKVGAAAAEVDYATADNTAAAPADYTAASGTLTFAADDETRSFTVSITDDDINERSETLRIVLSNPTNGAQLGSPLSGVVTIIEDDILTPVLTPAALTVDEGLTGAYTVALDHQPSVDVTATITGQSGTDLTVDTDTGMNGDQDTLTFTASDWDTPQTVHVSADQDNDDDHERVTLTHTLSGSGIGSRNTKNLRVTIRDDEAPLLSVTGTTETAAIISVTNHPATWYYKILAPAAGSCSGAQNQTDATLTNLTPGTAYTVASYGDSACATELSRLELTTRDPQPGVLVSGATIGLNELDGARASATYTVRLNTDPGAGVTVTVTASVDDDGAVTLDADPGMAGNQGAMAFTGSNNGTWATPQTVTLTAVNDGDVMNETVTLSHAVAAPSGNDYETVTVPDRTVTVLDAGHGFIVSPTALEVAADGAEDYALRLKSAPGATVTVTPDSSDDTHATVPSTGLQFTDSTWKTAQTVTVTAAGMSGDTATISHTVAAPNGNPYENLTPADVSVTLSAAAGTPVGPVLVSNAGQTGAAGGANIRELDQAQGFTTGAHGAGYTLTSVELAFTELFTTFSGLSLRIQASANGSPGSVVATLTTPAFTAGTLAYTFTAPGSGIDLAANTSYFVVLDSALRRGNRNSLLAVTASDAEDAGGAPGWSLADTSRARVYNATGAWVSNTNALKISINGSAKAAAGVTLTPTTVALTELHASDSAKTYTVALDTDPGSGETVTVTATSGKTAAVTVSPTTALSFVGGSGGAWNTAQTVTVTAVNDGDAANESVTISHALGGTSGTPYQGVSPGDVTVTVADAGHGVIANAAALSVRENDGTAGYTLALKSQPAGNVTVRPASGDDTHATVSGDLVFTNANWQTPQAVTVTGKGSATDTATITHSIHATSDTTNYPLNLGGLPTVTVTVTADTRPMLAAGSITMNSATITLSNVTGAWYYKTASGGTCSAQQSGSSFSLSSLSADTSYTYAVYSDSGCATELARVTFTTLAALPVISITAGTSPVTEGTNATFTVTASPAPSANLTVNLSVADAPAPSDFVAAGNQGSGKSVVITGGSATAAYNVATVGGGSETTDEPKGPVTVTVTSGSGYTVSSTAGSAAVTVEDDDATPVTLARMGSSGAIAESGGTATITVTLGRRLYAGETLTAPLDVSGTGIAAGDYTLARATGNNLNEGVTLNTGNPYSAAEPAVAFAGHNTNAVQTATLTLTATDDSTDEGASETLGLALGTPTGLALGGGGATTSGTVSVEITDDDDPPPSLGAGNITQAGATITLSNVSGTWYHKTATGGTCSAAQTGNSLALTGLDAGTAYTWAVYDDAACSNELARVTFSTLAATPEVSITAGTSPVTEGTNATFTVTASPAPSANLTVNLTVADAPAPSDFVDSTNQGSKSVVINAGASTAAYNVATVGTSSETTDEPDGPVTVSVAAGTGYTVSGTAGSARVTVNDNDALAVTLAAAAGDVAEGAAKTFTLTLGRALRAAESLRLQLTFAGDATRGTDYTTACPSPLPTGVTCADLNNTADGNIPRVAFAGSAAGSATSVILTLSAAADNDDTEGDEEVAIGLGTATGLIGGGGVDRTTSNTTFDITDVDSTAPKVTAIARQSPADSPTNADTLTWRVTFDEAVANVGAADFDIDGTTATLSVAAVADRGNAVYDVTAGGGNLAGLDATVTLSFDSAQDIADTAGNALTAVTPTGTNHATYVVDNTAPTVTISGVPAASSAAFTATFAFSEVVDGFAVGDIAVGNGSASSFTETVTDRTWTALITPTGSAVTVDVAAGVAEDAAGNGNTAAARASSTYTAPEPFLVSNVGQTAGNGYTSIGQDQAQAFTTGANATGYTLTGVDVQFSALSDTGLAAKLAVSIHESNNSNRPGTKVGDLTDPAFPTTSSDRTYRFAASGSGLALAANTTYFIVLDVGAAPSGNNRLRTTSSNSEDSGGASGWSIANSSLFRSRTATTWGTAASKRKLRVYGSANPAVTAGVTLSPTTVALTELHASDSEKTYTVVLDTDPGNGNTVTVTASSGKTAAVTVSPTTALSFVGGSGGSANWSTAQTVTVSAVNDGDAANESVTVSHALGGTSGTPYDGVMPGDVTVTVTDAGHGVIASESTLNVREAVTGVTDATATYTLALKSQPGGNVTVRPATSDAAHATVSGDLTFTSTNWQTPQAVTVTGKGESGDTATLTHSIHATNDGTNYPTNLSGLPSVAVTLSADTTPRLTASAITHTTATLTLSNVSGNWYYWQVLPSTGTCTAGTGSSIALTGLTPDTRYGYAVYSGSTCLDATLLTSSLFTTLETPVFAITQVGTTAITGSNVGRVAENAGATVITVTKTNADDAWGSATVNYRLEDITTTRVADYTATAYSGALSFAAAQTTQTLTVTIVDDTVPEANEIIRLHITDGTNSEVETTRNQVDTIIEDNDQSKSLYFAPASVTVPEGGDATYTVQLGEAPTGDVTVTVGGASGEVTADTDGTMNGDQSTLTFTTGNWATAQTVTVSADEDADTTNDSATLTHTAAGGGFDSVTGSVAVTVSDNDVALPEISITAGSSPVTEGTNAAFTVTASPAPSANLTVNLSVADAPNADFVAAGNQGSKSVVINAGASTAAYNVATVGGAGENTDEPKGPVTVTVAAGTGYTVSSSAGSAMVTVEDNDATTVTLARSGSSGAIAENGGTATITVTLGRRLYAGETLTAPLDVSGTGIAAGDYTLALSTGGNLNEGVTLSTGNPYSAAEPAVAFAGHNTNAVQTATLTLTATDDSTDEGASETLGLALGTPTGLALGGGGATTSGTVSVAITDDDASAVNLTVSAATVAEGASVTVTATRDEANTSGAALSIPIRVKAADTRRRAREEPRARPPPSWGAWSRCRRRWSATTGRPCWC